MSKHPKVLIGWMTHPDHHKLIKLIREAVSQRLIACGNVFSTPVTSLYTWDHKMEETSEYIAMFKIAESQKDPCIQFLKSQHPHECPEIIFSEVSGGFPDYLNWITETSRETKI